MKYFLIRSPSLSRSLSHSPSIHYLCLSHTRMAQQGVVLHQDQFCCSICLELFKDPVTVPCGHNYCSVCIEGHWDQDEQRGIYNCPQCRRSFTPRPELMRNNLLGEVVEKLKTPGAKRAEKQVRREQLIKVSKKALISP